MSFSKYQRYVEQARRAGLSEELIADAVRGFELVDTAIRVNGECPTCGAPVRRLVDPRQDGPTAVGEAGEWVMYRCSRDAPPGEHGDRPCGFALDVFEGPPD